MSARAVKQRYTPAKVGVQPPAKGKAPENRGKDADGEKQKKY